ncbi:hypothetical protein Tco_0963432, partial [Tanacetum coccineum]
MTGVKWHFVFPWLYPDVKLQTTCLYELSRKFSETIETAIKLLENNYESLKVMENNLESLKLHENRSLVNQTKTGKRQNLRERLLNSVLKWRLIIKESTLRPEEDTFDLDVYESYTNLFTIKCHYYGKFNDGPKKEYIEGETCFVDYVNRDQFTDVVLNSVINSLGYEMEDENEESESGSDSASESDNDFEDEEHVVQEVEVNMGDFNFQVEDASTGTDSNMIPVSPK